MKTLLLIYFNYDEHYANRKILTELYRDQFAAIGFLIHGSCPPDPEYRNYIAHWQPPPLTEANRCVHCGTRPAQYHNMHTRLAEIAPQLMEFDAVVFMHDDVFLSPSFSAQWVAQALEGYDALLMKIGALDPKRDTWWVWTNHDSGWPAVARVAQHFDQSTLSRNWRERTGSNLPTDREALAFWGEMDLSVLRTSLIQAMIPDLYRLHEVWSEVAIPTAIMHHTSRVGISGGLALWGEEREKSFDELLALAEQHPFVHPLKASTLDPSEAKQRYEQLRIKLNEPRALTSE